MRRKKQGLYLLLLILSLVGLAGCERGQEDDSEYRIFYVNKENTKTVARGYEPEAKDTEGMIQEFLDRLFQAEENKD